MLSCLAERELVCKCHGGPGRFLWLPPLLPPPRRAQPPTSRAGAPQAAPAGAEPGAPASCACLWSPGPPAATPRVLPLPRVERTRDGRALPGPCAPPGAERSRRDGRSGGAGTFQSAARAASSSRSGSRGDGGGGGRRRGAARRPRCCRGRGEPRFGTRLISVRPFPGWGDPGICRGAPLGFSGGAPGAVGRGTEPPRPVRARFPVAAAPMPSSVSVPVPSPRADLGPAAPLPRWEGGGYEPLTPDRRGLCWGRAGSCLSRGPWHPTHPLARGPRVRGGAGAGPSPGGCRAGREGLVCVASRTLAAEIPSVCVPAFIQRCFVVFKKGETPWREKGATIW